MSQIRPLLLSVKQRYSSSFSESTLTAVLFVVALIGAVVVAFGVSQQKYFLSSLGLLFSLIASVLICSVTYKRVINWPQVNRGWFLMAIAGICFVMREFLNLALGGVAPFTSYLFVALTLMAQLLFTGSLILIA